MGFEKSALVRVRYVPMAPKKQKNKKELELEDGMTRKAYLSGSPCLLVVLLTSEMVQI